MDMKSKEWLPESLEVLHCMKIVLVAVFASTMGSNLLSMKAKVYICKRSTVAILP